MRFEQFDSSAWDRVRRTAQQWWDGKLGRPLVQVRLAGVDAGRVEPGLPGRGFTAFYGMDVSAEAIVDRWDYELGTVLYLGDAFPTAWPNFGPGVLACGLGAEMRLGKDTVWFHPASEQDIESLTFAFDPSNDRMRRIESIVRAACERWQGRVQVGSTDLGGNLDILSTFRPSERLLLDLYDHPDHVKRLTWEAHRAWWEAFEHFDNMLRPVNPGYTTWAPVYSKTPFYMLQCDFCYMIGPDMFDEFVKPELAASAARLGHAFYHLDGPGELPHLDSLLDIDALDGVQWVSGDGQPGLDAWPEVYRSIHRAGKRIHLYGDGIETVTRILDAVTEQIGDASGIVMTACGSADELPRWQALLERYGVV